MPEYVAPAPASALVVTGGPLVAPAHRHAGRCHTVSLSAARAQLARLSVFAVHSNGQCLTMVLMNSDETARTLADRRRTVLRSSTMAADAGPALVASGSDGLRLEGARRAIYRGGHVAYLTRTEFLLLTVLAAHAPTLVTRDELHRRVWGCDFPLAKTANRLEVYIGYLRRKTETGGQSRLIHMVYGRGYRLDDLDAPSLTLHSS